MYKIYRSYDCRNSKKIVSAVAIVLLSALIAVGAVFAAPPALTSSITSGHVEVPGLGAYFLPAKGLGLSENFDGFASEERGIEVVVAIIKSPYATIEEGFNENTLKTRGVRLLSKAAFTLNGADATLMKALHPDGGRNWGKWILLLDGGESTLVVNGIFVSGDEASAVDVESMLKSVVFTSGGTQASQETGVGVEATDSE